MKDESLLTQTRKLLRRFNLQARKGLGQHFLIDEQVLENIIATAQLKPDDVVLEIGPGLGVLTGLLAGQAGWVIAIELDDRLAATLKKNLASFNNISIINRDILKVDHKALLEQEKDKFPPETEDPLQYRVVANLPYYITAPVLRHFLEAAVKPRSMVVMVQKEVAETIAAKPGRMSLLSVSVQYYGAAAIISTVPARCFYPEPEVDSAILKIDVYPQPVISVSDEKGFFNLVRAGFSASRKQIINSLAHGLDLHKTEILLMLEKTGISPQRRAETLSLEEWARLWQVFSGTGEPC